MYLEWGRLEDNLGVSQNLYQYFASDVNKNVDVWVKGLDDL